MRRATWLCLLIIGCASRPAAPEARPTKPSKPTVELAQPAQANHIWRALGGSAKRVGHAGLSVRYCCVAWGGARARLPVPSPGTYAVHVDYEAACASQHIVTLPGGNELPLGIVQAVTQLCPISARDAVHLQLRVVGGLGCCGRTEIRSIAARPSRRLWSEARCATFYKGLYAASHMGPERVVRFVHDVLRDRLPKN